MSLGKHPVIKSIERGYKRLTRAGARLVFRNKQVTLPLTWDKVQSILILRNDKIGDMVVTTPLFKILKENKPGLKVGVLASESNYCLVKNLPGVDSAYCYPKNILKRLNVMAAIRKARYDVCLNLIFNRASNIGMLANWLMPRGVKIGRNNPESNFYYNATIELVRGSKPMVDMVLDFAAAALPLKIRPEARQPFLAESLSVSAQVEQYLKTKWAHRGIILNISAGQARNVYPEAQFIQVCRLLRAACAVPIVLIYAPQDRAKALQIADKAAIDGLYVYDSTADLMEIAVLVKLAGVVISTDTAVVHFCSAYGTPVVALYSGKTTLWSEWVPYRVKHQVLAAQANQEISTITPQAIVAAVQQLLTHP